MNLLEEQVAHLMGEDVLEEEVEIEDEDRFKLKRVPDKVLAEAKNTMYSIEQGFIAKPNDQCDVRIRREYHLNYRGVYKYTQTTKFRPLNQEAEMEISEQMFNALWATATSKQTKTRYKWNGWDIDVFEDGGVVAEYEKGIGERPTIPMCFEIVKNG